MTNFTKNGLAAIIAALTLTACGDGGGGGSEPSGEPVPPTDNKTETIISPNESVFRQISLPEDTTFDGTGVRVAVYDSGINAAHEQFANLNISQFSGSFYSYITTVEGNVVRVLKETPGDNEDSDFSETNSGEAFHGNAVASTIAGETFGLATGTEMFIYDINNFGDETGNDAITVYGRPDTDAALLHTAANATTLDLDFGNYSIEGVSTVITDEASSNESTWDDIAKTDMGIITSANNDGYNYSDVFVNVDTVPKCTEEEFNNAEGYEYLRCFALEWDRKDRYPATLIPAYQEHVVIVGAVDQNSERERYSSIPGNDCRIQERWMVAPGTVTGAAAQSNTGTVYVSGTSFAAPQVAGAAALVKEAFPSLSNHGVLRLLLSTANQQFAAYDPELHGQGLLDIEAALTADPANYLDGVPGNLRKICSER